MPGKLMDKLIKSLVPKEKTYIQSDGDGMYLEVTPKGSKRWRMKYRFGGKENRLSLGLYPEVTLAQAKEEEERKGSTFEKVALEWHEKATTELAPKYRKQLLAQLKNYLFPFIALSLLLSCSAQT